MSQMATEGNITIVALASAAEVCGFTRKSVSVSPNETLGDALTRLEREAPGLRDARPRLRFAVNGAYAETDASLRPGDEVAIIPPVSGG